MKYWKNISQGWKRIHIVLSILLFIIFVLIDNKSEHVFGILLITIIPYYIIVILIEWIKEGFKK